MLLLLLLLLLFPRVLRENHTIRCSAGTVVGGMAGRTGTRGSALDGVGDEIRFHSVWSHVPVAEIGAPLGRVGVWVCVVRRVGMCRKTRLSCVINRVGAAYNHELLGLPCVLPSYAGTATTLQ